MKWLAPAAAWVLLCGSAAATPPRAKFKRLSFVVGQLDRHELSVPTSIPHYDLPANRLIFYGREVRLTIAGGFDGENFVFRINGLLNPDIQVVLGARITIVDLSLGGSNAFIIRDSPPPYNPSATIWKGPWQQWVWVGHIRFPGLPPLLPSGGAVFAATEVLVAENVGVAWWSNAGRGKRGCYGRMVVVP